MDVTKEIKNSLQRFYIKPFIYQLEWMESSLLNSSFLHRHSLLSYLFSEGDFFIFDWFTEDKNRYPFFKGKTWSNFNHHLKNLILFSPY